MAKKEKANMSGEAFYKGRRAGVSGSYGDKHGGVAEKTVVPKNDKHNSGGEDGLPSAAKSMYGKAVRNGGGSNTGGDPAVRVR